MDTTLKPEQRATLLVAAMTLPDKEEQLIGAAGVVPELPQCYGARHIPGLQKYRIPTLRVTNGPVGIGQNDCVSTSTAGGVAAFSDPSSAKATALPSAIAIAASFDPSRCVRTGTF
jgi:beta-glucosidase